MGGDDFLIRNVLSNGLQNLYLILSVTAFYDITPSPWFHPFLTSYAQTRLGYILHPERSFDH